MGCANGELCRIDLCFRVRAEWDDRDGQHRGDGAVSTAVLIDFLRPHLLRCIIIRNTAYGYASEVYR